VQGLSLPSVTIILSETMFADRQAYVGLSRAITPEELYITRLNFDAIKADLKAIAENRRLELVVARIGI
jgi:ATP-dependent exoDNAse (exonuclease V) alpha subunit